MLLTRACHRPGACLSTALSATPGATLRAGPSTPEPAPLPSSTRRGLHRRGPRKQPSGGSFFFDVLGPPTCTRSWADEIELTPIDGKVMLVQADTLQN